jgi:phage terminase large subunit
MPRAKHVFVGMDFGFTNDPTAIVEVIITADTIYLNEVCYRTEMVARDIIQVLNSRLHDRRVISESADPRLIKEIHNAGINIIPVEKFQGSIEAGINKMLEYRICVTKTSYNIFKELKNYTYQQDKEGRWLNKPIDAFNHAIDAARYVVLTEVLGKRKVKRDLRGYFD